MPYLQDAIVTAIALGAGWIVFRRVAGFVAAQARRARVRQLPEPPAKAAPPAAAEHPAGLHQVAASLSAAGAGPGLVPAPLREPGRRRRLHQSTAAASNLRHFEGRPPRPPLVFLCRARNQGADDRPEARASTSASIASSAARSNGRPFTTTDRIARVAAMSSSGLRSSTSRSATSRGQSRRRPRPPSGTSGR